TDLDWAGMLMGIGMGLAILAFIANRMLVTPVACVALYAVPALLLWMSLRAVRQGDDQAASPLA
ncbi:MAG: type IV secretory pathway VirB3-like protein, partial [Planctomycetota bacterium]